MPKDVLEAAPASVCIPVVSTTTPAQSGFPILVIDTATTTTTVGLGTSPHEWVWRSDCQEAGIALFASLESVLTETAASLESVRCLAFCEGPGSMLGIRTAVMAIRTWIAAGSLSQTQLMTYSSLALAANAPGMAEEPNGRIMAIDARRQSWHCLRVSPTARTRNEIQRIPHDAMMALQDPIFLPEGFPVWNPRPEHWKTSPYSPALLESDTIRQSILRMVDQAEAWQPEPPTYQKWVPTVSRSPEGTTSARETRS